jgi:hypothetical protein
MTDYRITWRDRWNAFKRRLVRDPARRDQLTLTGLILLFLLFAIFCLHGCAEARQQVEHKTLTERWQGSFTVPVPTTVNGQSAIIDTPIPFAITRTLSEDTDGSSKSMTGLDPAAVGQLTGAIVGELKKSIPLLGALTPSEDNTLGKTLAAVTGATTLIAGGIAAVKSRSAARHRAEADEAWDEAREQERAKHAAEIAALKARATPATT